MAFRTLVALFICIGFFSIVNSDFLPTNYFRGFVGNVLDVEKAKNGTATFTIDSDVIANISTFQDWEHHEEGNITIVDGGIGENHVTFQYIIPEGAAVYFETRIYIPEDIKDMDNNTVHSDEEFQFRRKNFARGNEVFAFMAIGEYRSSNTSRTETFTYSFSDVILQCNGDTMWTNGKGNRIVDGGIDTNYLDVTLLVPEGVDSRHRYSCLYVKDFNGTDDNETRSAVSMFRDKVFAAEEGEVFFQGCHSIEPNMPWMVQTFDGVIVDYDIESEWKNGNGTMTVVEGGLNFTYITLGFETEPYAFGTLRSNFTIKDEQ